MRNLLTQLREVIGTPRLEVATVLAVDGSAITVQLSGGGIQSVRGFATLGSKVYVRDGVVEGDAPDLTVYPIDI